MISRLSNARNPRKALVHKGNLSDASEGTLPVSNPCFGVLIPSGTFGALRRLLNDELNALKPLLCMVQRLIHCPRNGAIGGAPHTRGAEGQVSTPPPSTQSQSHSHSDATAQPSQGISQHLYLLPLYLYEKTRMKCFRSGAKNFDRLRVMCHIWLTGKFQNLCTSLLTPPNLWTRLEAEPHTRSECLTPLLGQLIARHPSGAQRLPR